MDRERGEDPPFNSNPGDVVLDPFCGCGTAVDAAQKLGRRWIGVPRDLASAGRLAADDPHQFQQWVSWQVGGYPRDRKGADALADAPPIPLATPGSHRSGGRASGC